MAALAYRRMPIEVESPEEQGYDSIRYNLCESSVSDMRLDDLDVDLKQLVLAYTDHRGHRGLRGAIADGAGLDPDDLIVTPGAAAALFIAATALVDRGDHVVVIAPNYATNIETPRAIGANVELHPLRFEERWDLDVDRLAARLTPHTKLLSITYPHNPTGAMITPETFARVIALAESRGCRLLVDETYREMAFTEALPSGAAASPNVVSVSSLSKTYGVPGIRMGWLATTDPALKQIFLAAKEQIFICNSVIDEEVAFQIVVRHDSILPTIRRDITARLNIVREWIEHESDVDWVEPSGGVAGFPRLGQNVDPERFYTALGQRRTAVGPGHWFDTDRRFFRLGFGWPALEELRGGLRSLSEAVASARR